MKKLLPIASVVVVSFLFLFKNESWSTWVDKMPDISRSFFDFCSMVLLFGQGTLGVAVPGLSPSTSFDRGLLAWYLHLGCLFLSKFQQTPGQHTPGTPKSSKIPIWKDFLKWTASWGFWGMFQGSVGVLRLFDLFNAVSVERKYQNHAVETWFALYKASSTQGAWDIT